MKGKIRHFLFLLAASVAIQSALAEPVGLRFSTTAEIAELKLLVPVLQRSREQPMKPPENLRYRLSLGEQVWFEDRSYALELWAEPQFVSCWVDPLGNVQLLSMMSTLLPDALAQAVVTREVFESAMDSPDLQIDAYTPEAKLVSWMEHYSGSSVVKDPVTLRINTSRLAKLLAFPLADPNTRAYAFRLNPGYPGQGNAPRGWFALILSLSNTPSINADSSIQDQLLANIRTTSGFEGTRAQSVRKNRSRNLQAETLSGEIRERARRSIAYLSDWWYMESPDYILLSDNRSAESVAASLLDDLQRMRPFYDQATTRFAATGNEIGVLRLFEWEEDYITYLGDNFIAIDAMQTAGIFDGRRRELVIRPISSMKAEGEGSVRGTILHEGFHQHLFAATGGIETSPWINEGLAMLFENATVNHRGKIEMDESRYRVARLEQLFAQSGADWEEILTELLFMDYAQFYAAPDINYPIAYGMVYFLIRGAPLLRNKPYADILPTYWAELESSTDPIRSTEAAFRDVDMKRFAKHFREFWKSEKDRRDARNKPGF